jgi:hypothetical protein
MLIQPSTRHLKRFVFTLLIVMVADLFVAPAASPGIKTTNDVFSHFRQGPAPGCGRSCTCDAKETVVIRVTVTQRSTGAIAEADISFTATGELQDWLARLPTIGRQAFEEGPVTVVYLIHTSYRGDSTDANQWLVNDLVARKE